MPRAEGPYRLPHDAEARLVAALGGLRNREAAFALAVFLARFWSAPDRLALAFPVDRRKLADRPDLGLTADQVRGALGALERIGFVAREIPTGSQYRRTPEGRQRKPILFRFGGEWGEAFATANARARAARGGLERKRRPVLAPKPPRPSAGILAAPARTVPHNQSQASAGFLMGEAGLEGALARFGKLVARSEGLALGQR